MLSGRTKQADVYAEMAMPHPNNRSWPSGRSWPDSQKKYELVCGTWIIHIRLVFRKLI